MTLAQAQMLREEHPHQSWRVRAVDYIGHMICKGWKTIIPERSRSHSSQSTSIENKQAREAALGDAFQRMAAQRKAQGKTTLAD